MTAIAKPVTDYCTMYLVMLIDYDECLMFCYSYPFYVNIFPLPPSLSVSLCLSPSLPSLSLYLNLFKTGVMFLLYASYITRMYVRYYYQDG